MAKRAFVLSAVAVLLGGIPLRAEPRATQEELALTLTCKPPSFKVRRPSMVLNGSCPLPDGVILKVNLSRILESLSGSELQESATGAGSGSSEVEGRKYSYEATIEGPGKFMAQVGVFVDMQEKQHADEVRKKTGTRQNWQFEFMVWGDELVTQLPGKLTEMLSLVKETLELAKRFEAACSSEQGWAGQSKGLVAEGNKMRVKLENHELKAFFPAAVNNMFYTVRNMVTNAPYYTFSDGKFTGAKDYHADQKKVQTFKKEEFSWENLKRYIEESGPCAGREFSLWIVKDLRRTAGQMRSEISDAVRQQKAAPGVDLFVDRLLKATISDLGPLENDIRGVAKK
ncbi:MAG TPA: hypothetical protein VE981_22595 [Planctomycetota bacterium]|nr:hypothetical protein [Planctomycetota bacterium]